MIRVARILSLGIILMAFLWLFLRQNPVLIPIPIVYAAILDPFETPLLADHKLLREALAVNDLQTLSSLAYNRSDYIGYKAALLLARQASIGLAERLNYYQRVFAIRLDDPLDKLDRRALWLEYAAVAEQAAELTAALEAYKNALPETAAIEGLKRLQTDPYRLANTFLQAKLNRLALETLAGRSAPSIEAPAYRAIGAYAEALDAYERWLAEIPNDATALEGKAWTHYYLAEYEAADAIFSGFTSARAFFGRALVAQQQGNTSAAVQFLQQTGDPADLWFASGLLEAEDRYTESLPIYLELAKDSSSLADDAAYRAYILATRLGDQSSADTALAQLPGNSFFSLKLGLPYTLEASSNLPVISPDATARALALAAANLLDDAIGELSFALRTAQEPSEIVAIAEQLQRLGEFRQSQRAASNLLAQGQKDIRIWRLAYPQAYSEFVRTEAARLDVEPALVWSIMRQESAFYPKALSTSNAQGLMQVIPSTWDWLAELQKETPANPFDPATNIRYGIFYLRWLKNYFSAYAGDPELVIASYNRGQGYIKRLFESSPVNGNKDELYREIDALETREYLQKVVMNYQVYKVLYAN